MHPLVTIICLCYNHEKYVLDALDSVRLQTYPNIQVIVVDDASSDESPSLIRNFLKETPSWEFIELAHNQGNCKAFNTALKRAQGNYIVDFATDDILHPQRILMMVEAFERQPEYVGLLHSNGLIIDSEGNYLRHYHPIEATGDTKKAIPQGDVFADVLQGHFICPPSMLMRKKMLDELGGYDEELSFEDFDLWVRASRNWHFCYLNQALTSCRKSAKSLSETFKYAEVMHESIVQVCEKAAKLIKSEKERQALNARINYQIREAHRANADDAVKKLQLLLQKNGRLHWKTRLSLWFNI